MDFAAFANEIGTGEPVKVELARPDGDPITLVLRHPNGTERLALHSEVMELMSKLNDVGDDVARSPALSAAVGGMTAKWASRLGDPPVTPDAAANALHATNGVQRVFIALIDLVIDRPAGEDGEEAGVDDADRFRNDHGS